MLRGDTPHSPAKKVEKKYSRKKLQRTRHTAERASGPSLVQLLLIQRPRGMRNRKLGKLGVRGVSSERQPPPPTNPSAWGKQEFFYPKVVNFAAVHRKARRLQI
ncbi:hypothetical protein A6R68_11268 [Neotoma lepida]|uniref:Uncharacterized protein n=1 Tax=Neotoma lepida TaxID=56216 RepID=A0A1A6FWN5_NEOLE|nr:hypothetical protein A6R68_11268 [Neotoma lepida]